MTRKLTAPQRLMLSHVARIADDNSFDGYAPHGRSEHKTIYALVDRGLVRFVAMGECGDGCERAGDCPHPVKIYTLTDAGHEWLDAHDVERAVRGQLGEGTP